MGEALKIAIPTVAEGGLDAHRSAHFGHASTFTLVDVTDGEVGDVSIIENPPHSSGGCMMTVNLLANAGVTTVAVSGMGRGPLVGLQRLGIDVLHEGSGQTAREAIDAVIDGKAEAFGTEDACAAH
jgi:predicted Fe-Mo cluster-binding NifX family protein